MFKKKRGFSLVEIMVSLVVFGLVMATASSVFYKFYQDYQRQKKYLECLENTRWAFEYMAKEIRDSQHNNPADGGNTLKCKDPGSGPRTWFERELRIAPSGDGDLIKLSYRDPPAGWEYHELCNFVVNNPSLNSIFTREDWASPTPDCIIMELTVRPNPDPAVSSSNSNRRFTVRTKVRMRN